LLRFLLLLMHFGAILACFPSLRVVRARALAGLGPQSECKRPYWRDSAVLAEPPCWPTWSRRTGTGRGTGRGACLRDPNVSGRRNFE